MTNQEVFKQAMQNDWFYADKNSPPISLEEAEKLPGNHKLYIQKQNEGESSWVDPGGTDYHYIKSTDLLNGWFIGGLSKDSKNIYKRVTQVDLTKIFTQDFYKDYISGFLYFQPFISESKNEIQTRFCGLTIGKLLRILGCNNLVSKEAWKKKPPNHWIPPFWFLVKEFLKEYKENNNTTKNFLALLETTPSLHENYFLPINLTFFEQLKSLIQTIKIKNIKDLVLLILLKAFYLERLLNGLGLFHLHLYYENITVEFVDKLLEFENIRNLGDLDKITFDFKEFLKFPDKYHLVLRAIDLAGINFIDEWVYPKEEFIFIDKDAWLA